MLIGISQLCGPECFNRKLQGLVNKSVMIILIWSLSAFVMGKVFYNTYFLSEGGYFIYGYSTGKWHMVVLIILATVLPATGGITDIIIGRYRVIKTSLILMWIGSMTCAFLDVLQMADIAVPKLTYFIEFAELIGGLGLTVFLANIVQFSLDQFIDFSSEKMIFFILLTMALSCDLLFNTVFIKEPVTSNPIRLIYRVLKYALKNKHPRLRSAFTYWDDKPYSRIDLGKNKFGGPFTTEQVEDVKTFFRVVAVVYLSSFFVGVVIMTYFSYLSPSDGFINVDSGTQVNTCLQTWVIARIGLVAIVFGFPLYFIICPQIFWRVCVSVKIITRVAAGMFTMLLALVSLTLGHFFETILYSTSYQNCTFLFISNGDGSSVPFWTVLPNCLFTVGFGIFLVSLAEFVLAQTPYSMKGLVVGFVLSSFFVNLILIFFVFKFPFFRYWNSVNVVLDCWFWFLFCSVIECSITFVLFLIVRHFYKPRVREDHPPSLQYFAERYYDPNYYSSKDLNSE